MTDPNSTETKEAVVKARQPEESDGKTFVRVFSFAHSVSDDHPMHEPNKDETKRDALRRGLVPTGDVTFKSEVQEYPNATVVTYSVPVEPTPGAVTNSTSKPNPPAQEPEAPVKTKK